MAREAKVSIIVAAKDLTKRGLARARSGFQRLKGVLFSVQSAVLALTTGALAQLGRKLFEVGSAAEETRNKFREVFRGMVQDMMEFVEEFSTMSGLTRREMQDLVATTGMIAQGLGFARERSAEFEKEIFKLGADLASFNDIPTAQAVEAINAALTGERERLKRLGIVLRQVDVDQRAMAISGAQSADAVTDLARAQASLQLITEKAGAALGDNVRTQDSAARTAKSLRAAVGDLKDTLGEVFVEVVTGSADLGGMADSVEELEAKLRANADAFVAWGRVAVDAMKFVFETGRFAVRFVKNAVDLAVNFLMRAFASAAGGFARLASLIPGVEVNAEKFFDFAEAANANYTQDLHDLLDAQLDLSDAWLEIRDSADAAWRAQERAKDAARSGLEEATSASLSRAQARGFDVAGGLATTTGPGISTGPVSAQLRGPARPLPPQVAKSYERVLELTKKLQGESQTLGQVIADSLTAGMNRFGGAVSEAFKLWADGSESAAQAFVGAFKGAISAVAETMGRYFMAQGVAAMGLSLVPPPLGSPTGAAAAAKFFAAGAAMFALSGLAQAIGPSGGGGAAGASADARGDRTRGEVGEARIVLQGSNVFDLDDPRTEERWKSMLEELTGRRIIVQREG